MTGAHDLFTDRAIYLRSPPLSDPRKHSFPASSNLSCRADLSDSAREIPRVLFGIPLGRALSCSPILVGAAASLVSLRGAELPPPTAVRIVALAAILCPFDGVMRQFRHLA
jgi:hypothetical protein